MVKPQIAFYEALGPDGLRALRTVIDMAHAADMLVLLDAKRCDIGPTAQAYSIAAFDPSRLNADAVTLLPTFGLDGVQPFIDFAREAGKGVYVVVHSSNDSAAEVQDVHLSTGDAYYELIGLLVASWGRELISSSGYSSIGAVMGATFPTQLSVARQSLPSVPFLVPGYGTQGATGRDVAGAFDANGTGAVVAASRSITNVDGRRELSRRDFVDLVRSRAEEMTLDIMQSLEPAPVTRQAGSSR
jgi:orotidine-5'-phosphate decarboxylase